MNNDFIEIEEDFKKKKNIKKPLINIVTIITLLTGFFLIGSIYSMDGIENNLRYVGMGLIFIINIVLTIIYRKLLGKEKKGKIALGITIVVILVLSQLFIGYFLFKTFTTLNSMNKDKITYTTAIVTKEDSNLENIQDLTEKKIGIVVDETSIDSYVIGLEIIEKENLEDKNKIIEYTDFSNLVKDLYNKKLDAIIISKNYPSMFRTITDYKNIEKETKTIYEKSKTLTKDEIAKYTGEELVNFNKSDKIDKPFTMLVMGIDSTATTLSKNATGNGDALMLITFNPKTLNATILSIPRDTYVPIACFENQKENKITHAAWNGESCMIKTIENFIGIDIDYYAKINFQGVVKLVNALDGITVDVPVEFCESNSKRSTKEQNLICLKKGKQKLNGEQALALARHRKTLLTGDLQRGTNQQLVVQGILNKIKTVKSANKLLNVLDTISQSMDTNFTTKQILSFYDIAKKLFLTSTTSNLITMNQLYLQGASQMIYDEGLGLVLYNYIPNKESLELIIKAMKQNLGLEEIESIKKMEFSIEKPFKLETIGSNVSSGAETYTLLPSFIGESQSYATSWLNNNGISVNIVEKEVSSGVDGQVIDQSLPQGKRIDLISGGITLTIAKVIKEEPKQKQEPKKEEKKEEPEKKTEEVQENTEETLPDELAP